MTLPLVFHAGAINYAHFRKMSNKWPFNFPGQLKHILFEAHTVSNEKTEQILYFQFCAFLF